MEKKLVNLKTFFSKRICELLKKFLVQEGVTYDSRKEIGKGGFEAIKSGANFQLSS
jgi:hypothetical protein